MIDLEHAVADADCDLRIPVRVEGIELVTALDLRLAWQPRKDLELSLVGQNLLDNAHPEYGSSFILSTPSEIQRGVYLKADWKF